MTPFTALPSDMSMKLVRIHAVEDLQVDRVAVPEPGPGDVMLRIGACGICGTDIKFAGMGGLSGAPNPMPLGHEAAGVVTWVGAAVSDIAPGDRLAVNPIGSQQVIGCGSDVGGLGELLLVRTAELGVNLFRIPPDVPLAVAALAEPLAVALHGINRATVEADSRVAVFGMGPIGLGVVLWLADRGVRDIVAIDPHAARLELALAMGARQTIHARHDDIRARLEEFHGSEHYRFGSCVGTDIFLDVAGGPTLISEMVAMGKPNAKIVSLAVYAEPVLVPFDLMLRKEIWITTAAGYPTEFGEVVEALPRIMDRAERMISGRYPLDRFAEAFTAAKDRNSAKIIIEFDSDN